MFGVVLVLVLNPAGRAEALRDGIKVRGRIPAGLVVGSCWPEALGLPVVRVGWAAAWVG